MHGMSPQSDQDDQETHNHDMAGMQMAGMTGAHDHQPHSDHNHEMHGHDMADHDMHDHDMAGMPGMSGHDMHGGHAHHVAQFRRLFWIMLALAIPTVAFDEMFAHLLGYHLPAAGWVAWISPILGTITPDSRGGKPISQTNTLLREVAAQKKIALADHYAAVKDNWSSLTADGLHPNSAGYSKIAQVWTRAMDEADKMNAPTTSLPPILMLLLEE